ncbi:hypothetical protein Taro_024242, partial [Colocasia esculenta]|nr:hypothetical protein [Colocasia esculenta]
LLSDRQRRSSDSSRRRRISAIAGDWALESGNDHRIPATAVGRRNPAPAAGGDFRLENWQGLLTPAAGNASSARAIPHSAGAGAGAIHPTKWSAFSCAQSQLVCSGCRNLLLYPVGATSVCCAVCNAVTAVPPPGTEMAQLLCGGCHTLLMYIRGATSVQCSCCHTINLALEANQVAHVNCGNCRMLLMYQYGARSVKCAVCNFVTQIGVSSMEIPGFSLSFPCMVVHINKKFELIKRLKKTSLIPLNAANILKDEQLQMFFLLC